MRTLVDIVGWLIVNSMRSEQIQWSMLSQQSLMNIYRKNAYWGLLLNMSSQEAQQWMVEESEKERGEKERLYKQKQHKEGKTQGQGEGDGRQERVGTTDMEATQAQQREEVVQLLTSGTSTTSPTMDLVRLSAPECRRIFDEAVDFSLEATVPDPVPFSEKLRGLLVGSDRLVLTGEQVREGGHGCKALVGARK